MRLLNRLAASMVLPLAACAVGPSSSSDTGFGASPAMPAPESMLIPMVNIAPVRARPAGFMPIAPNGFSVTEFAGDLAHPRWLYTLPNGDVLVAESDAPKEHDEGSGIFGWIRRQVMKRAGAGVTSPDRIALLRDANGSGVAQMQSVFLRGLHSPFGMALIGNKLYVADTDALLRFDYAMGATQITSPDLRLPICQPARSIITGQKISSRITQASIYTSLWDQIATREKMASPPKKAAHGSLSLTWTRVACGPMRQDCAMPTAFRGNRTAGRCGRQSTSGTISVTTLYRIT